MSSEEIILEEEDFQNLENKLEALLLEVGSTAALLLDRNGFLILAKGNFPDLDPEDFGVMASAAFTALNQMMNNKSDRITVNFHSPQDENILCHILHHKMFLVLIFKSPVEGDPERAEKIDQASQSFLKDVKRIFFP
ncbi:hypothetical protein JW926_18025 [Candidatus Sumerlaeota bacterium]|nr:hypothetical protein [Candidatus Sumerlaeota bacterium]